ncbi:tyrosine-type recombinase/integrase [Microlunatus panaciterrae]|nr:tyrosine-type recombinase/integrase [Microlunatus panaciterrae]
MASFASPSGRASNRPNVGEGPRRSDVHEPRWRADPAAELAGRATAHAGLSGLAPHDLRHTAASLTIASGASVKGVQRMLGNHEAAMTLNVYASQIEDDLDHAFDRVATAPGS